MLHQVHTIFSKLNKDRVKNNDSGATTWKNYFKKLKGFISFQKKTFGLMGSQLFLYFSMSIMLHNKHAWHFVSCI